MKRFTTFACLMVALVFALGVNAGDLPRIVDGHDSVIHGGSSAMTKAAARDTVYLIGPWSSGAQANGQFEDASGAPAWNGWTSLDFTQKTEPIWHADTYNAVSGVYSAWCGELDYPSCGGTDIDGGYGNNYNELLVWRKTVGNPGASTVVDVSAVVNHNTEPGYDYSYLGFYKADAPIDYMWTADGAGVGVVVTGQVTYAPGEYVGDSGNEVAIAWRTTSDGAWSDADCSWGTNGATQVDDVVVTMTNDGVVTSTTDDFEDGTLGVNWAVEYPVGVGDYAHIKSQMADIDPCRSNFSPLVVFTADEEMLNERGLPTQQGLDWIYGPGGYIVTTNGGAAGPDNYTFNGVISPVVDWPAGDYLGAQFLWDIYRHSAQGGDNPGMYYYWGVRSADTDLGEVIEDIEWANRNFIYYGGPDYIRAGEEVTDLMTPGRDEVQVMLSVYQASWRYYGDNGYPAPYMDNVSFSVYDYFGPGMTTREIDLAQDTFPSSGLLNFTGNLGGADCRFDMANSIALATDERNDPGDSVVIDIAAVRTGSSLVLTDVDATVVAPRLNFTLKMNPLFDSTVRLGVGPFTTDTEGPTALNGQIVSITGDIMTGYVTGAFAEGANGSVSDSKFMFDLPDADFLYPGDVLHYYIEAWDDVAGDYQSATLPADLTGYGVFDGGALAYSSSFTVRALPTIFDEAGDQPSILFWNDFANRGGQQEWHGAFSQLGFVLGETYDTYYTNGPSSGVGNGLGGRATIGQLDNYDVIVYTAGDLTAWTISNEDWDQDPGDDLGLITDWLNGGGKKLFATGDGLVTDLADPFNAQGQAFISSWLGLNYVSNDAAPLIGSNITPTVVATNATVFAEATEWIAYGGCLGINTFDAVTVTDAGGSAIARFAGYEGATDVSAATLYSDANLSEVITMPYDFMYIRNTVNAAKAEPASLPARAIVLKDILSYFGKTGDPQAVTPVGLPGAKFAAANYPNPFNPSTKIAYTMPKAGHLTLKVYNVRGELVKTLIDDYVTESGHVMWDGTNDQGKGVSSGVYFYEARTGSDVVVNKMALVK